MHSDFKLHHGDNAEVLREYPENYFDCVVMDPPYGIRFMGKAWDNFDIQTESKSRNSYALSEARKASGRTTTGFGDSIASGNYNLKSNRQFQSWFTEKCVEFYRVLKPGGHLISFGSTRTHHRMISGIEDAGFEIRDTLNWIFSSGFPKSHNDHERGLGSALKPAHEPIVLARKKLDGTLAENFTKWGTGYLNIDKCRIPGEAWVYGTQPKINNNGYTPGEDRDVHARNVVGGKNGRWPANLLHDGSEEVLSVFPNSKGQNGDVKGTEPSNTGGEGTVAYGKFNRVGFRKRIEDEGSAARFFYHAKCSRTDRNEGCESFDKKPMNWSSGTQNPGSLKAAGTDRSSQNNWPTVKPTNLMRYLIRLVNPSGGIVLDPFMGSGSTGKAAMYEFCKFVGIDQESDAMSIAQARIEYAIRNRSKQLDIF